MAQPVQHLLQGLAEALPVVVGMVRVVMVVLAEHPAVAEAGAALL